jgi:hypothetical protein
VRFIALVTLVVFLTAGAFAQQPQTSDVTNTQPLYSVNAKYVEGVGPGYWPTAGSGLTLNIAKGTAFCSGAVATYAGGTLTMANNTTNYVYLNTSSSCVPAVKTTTFTSSDILIAVVVTSGGVIIPNGITDDRTWFVPAGGCGNLTLTGDVTSSGCATTLPNIVTASTQTKITYNAKGQVTAGAQAQFSDLGGSEACSQTPTLTGDVTTSAGSCATTMASVVTASSCGDATHSCGLTYDAKGRITVATNNVISGGSGGADTFPFDQCTASQTSNAGNSFWTVLGFTNWDVGHWEDKLNTNADIFCSIRVPSSTTSTPHILLDPGSADTASGHTASLQTCDVQTTSLNLQAGTLTCASAQNYSSTTTAYSVTELSFAVQSTVTAGQILVVKIHQASGGTNTSNIVMPPPKYKIN